jgi:hypothetical protein
LSLAHDPKKVADFSDKIMRKIKENRERCRFHLIEKRSSETAAGFAKPPERRLYPALPTDLPYAGNADKNVGVSCVLAHDFSYQINIKHADNTEVNGSKKHEQQRRKIYRPQRTPPEGNRRIISTDPLRPSSISDLK